MNFNIENTPLFNRKEILDEIIEEREEFIYYDLNKLIGKFVLLDTKQFGVIDGLVIDIIVREHGEKYFKCLKNLSDALAYTDKSDSSFGLKIRNYKNEEIWFEATFQKEIRKLENFKFLNPGISMENTMINLFLERCDNKILRVFSLTDEEKEEISNREKRKKEAEEIKKRERLIFPRTEKNVFPVFPLWGNPYVVEYYNNRYGKH